MKPYWFSVSGRSVGFWLFCGVLGTVPLAISAAEEGAAKPVPARPVTAPAGGEANGRFALTPSGAEDAFEFQTDRMEGTIGLAGAYHGVTRLVDRGSGRQVIDPRYSALNLFKLMSVNQIMGQPRSMERTTQVAPNRVEVSWAATDGHKAQITARYEVPEPNAVDVTVTVRSQGAYRGYELFMSSYFDKTLRPYVYLKSRGGQEPELVLPMASDVFRGTVLVFPRDAHAARRCVDGRWDRNEWKTPIVQMCPVRHYAHCLALMTDPEKQLGVVLMAHPRDCYAISTRYFAEDDAERLTTYSAFDLSLFGDDLLPGDERSVKVRLALIPLDGDPSRALELYERFVAETSEGLDAPHPSDTKGEAK